MCDFWIYSENWMLNNWLQHWYNNPDLTEKLLFHGQHGSQNKASRFFNQPDLIEIRPFI